ncbi:hypothetical protein [Tsukamurella paurometabola]|uniref:Uncharacterized protein n=1 Tax=Tsukamurella paurometabola TaxID=2061 RepID=A0A3P8MBR7_TSUPA|nr:hypothetical protein [Tsukamurella paurometabola]UEA84428.1 hypothetical protein LK411_06290 [Tsukamurella paurometabola]VDR36993.1 Uncharacterised protein [Tsukamurella paurometabola]
MTAPKLDVQPGWRGTEDLTDAAPAPLEPEGYVTVPGFGKWLPRGLKYLFEQIGVPEGGCAVMEAVDAVLENRQPAPLDPGNPEHLRQVAEFLTHVTATLALHDAQAALIDAENVLYRQAERLDRERAEAEQDAADRERAEEYARTRWEFDTPTYWECVDAYLAGIRAERARLEVGQ